MSGTPGPVPEPGATVSVQAVETLDGGVAREWDALAAEHGLYVTSSWLRFVEWDGAARTRYLLARTASGEVVGGLPVSVIAREDSALYRPAEVLAGLDGPWSQPLARLGARRGYAADVLVAPALPAPERRAVVAALLAVAEDLAHAEGLEGGLVLYATDRCARRVVDVRPGTLPVLLAGEGVIELGNGDFEAFLERMPMTASKARREMRDFAAAGYDVGVASLAEVAAEAGPLLGQVQRRHGHASTDEAMRRLLERQAEAMDHLGTVYACRRGGCLVACSLFYEAAGMLYGRMVGFDYRCLVGAFEYFNLTYYRPVRDALHRGLDGIHLGIGSLRAKALRGATVRPLWALAVGTRQPDAATVRDWNRARLEEIRAEAGTGTSRHALAPARWRWEAAGLDG